MKKVLLLLAFLSLLSIQAQQNVLPKDTEISILTVGSGNALNDAFGHSGFRIKSKYQDVVYNYGMFNFNEPNFYLNFVKGKLNYYMGQNAYSRFRDLYIWQNRTIKEQVLNLNYEQKQAFSDFLTNNLKPENKFYLYDFFYDNCATKMRDVSEIILYKNIEYKTPEVYKEETFRQLIQNNLHWNSWGSFGIDIALGAVIDKKASPREYMFLPENIYQFFNVAVFKGSKTRLVKTSKVIYEAKPSNKKNSFLFSPIAIFTLLGLVILLITFLDNKNNRRSKILDVMIFITTGLVGVLLTLLWFATDHSATVSNYNILWACPISLITVFQAFKNTPASWFLNYLKLLIIMLCLLTLHWLVGVQSFPTPLIPLLVALVVRYLFLIRFYKKK